MLRRGRAGCARPPWGMMMAAALLLLCCCFLPPSWSSAAATSTLLPPAAAAAAPPPPGAPSPPLPKTRTYLLLDSRNVQDSGSAKLVLGPVTKGTGPLLTETERWEMRFDNMQPNVFFDGHASKWRAWYSTMSQCGGNITGPGRDPSLPPDCQALPSNCSADADPSWRWRCIKRAGAFAYAESTDGLVWEKPHLAHTEWPAGSGDTANNILFTFGFGSTGGCGTGIFLDTSSGAAGVSRCQSWTPTNWSDCAAYRNGTRVAHTVCGGSHHSILNISLEPCRAACSADPTCSVVQWQGAAAHNFSASKPGQCNLFEHCAPSPYSGSHGPSWCMQIDECVRGGGKQPPRTRFKMFGQQGTAPLLGESNDGVNFSNLHSVSIPHGRFDTHKNLVFDPVSRKWIGYVRCSGGPGNLRVQCYTESASDNFTSTTWSPPMPTGLNTSEYYQPDALVAFHYAPAGVWLGFANVFNPSGPGKGGWRKNGHSGQAPVGVVYGVLAWSADARHWHYIAPEQSFVPLGTSTAGDFDCCGVFMAKQNPVETPQFHASEPDTSIPLYYAGSNGQFFGPRAGALGLASVPHKSLTGRLI
jgi:hypothetical protein